MKTQAVGRQLWGREFVVVVNPFPLSQRMNSKVIGGDEDAGEVPEVQEEKGGGAWVA